MADSEKQVVFKWRNQHQYYAALAANIIMLSHGVTLGWLSPALPKLMSETDSPLVSGPLNSQEVSWIGSITNIGALCGSFTFGFFTTFLGCKRAMIFLAGPSTLFWILIYFGDTYHIILLARFFTGWTGGGIQTTIVLFISEISNNECRGKLGAMSQLSKNTGTLISYVVGAVVAYKYIPCIFVSCPLLYVLCFTFIPNTPQYFLRKKENQQAEDALKFYKNYKGKTEEEIAAFAVEFERLKSIANEQRKDEKIHFADFTTKEASKGLIIGIALAYFTQLTGHVTIIAYAVYIFERTGTSFDPYLCSIALAVMQIVGSLCTNVLGDKFGRKSFLIMSLMGCAVGHACLSLFMYFSTIGYDLSAYAWVPVCSLAFVIFTASAGIIPISHVCRVEHLPTKIRTIGNAICIFAMNTTTFICTKLFPLLIDSLGLHGCMSIFAINCIIGSFFIFFVLKETRGKPMDTLKTAQSCIDSNK